MQGAMQIHWVHLSLINSSTQLMILGLLSFSNPGSIVKLVIKAAVLHQVWLIYGKNFGFLQIFRMVSYLFGLDMLAIPGQIRGIPPIHKLLCILEKQELVIMTVICLRPVVDRKANGLLILLIS